MIPEYRKILYATDLSLNSAHALRHAVGLARRYNARVTLLHVLPEIEPALLNYVSTVMGEEQLAALELSRKDEVRDEIRLRVHQFAKDELDALPEDEQRIEQIEIHHGNPVARILEYADELDVDLIVLGSHGKGALRYAFLGSVAEKVLRKCHRPVLVVPLEANAKG